MNSLVVDIKTTTHATHMQNLKSRASVLRVFDQISNITRDTRAHNFKADSALSSVSESICLDFMLDCSGLGPH